MKSICLNYKQIHVNNMFYSYTCSSDNNKPNTLKTSLYFYYHQPKHVSY